MMSDRRHQDPEEGDGSFSPHRHMSPFDTKNVELRFLNKKTGVLVMTLTVALLGAFVIASSAIKVPVVTLGVITPNMDRTIPRSLKASPPVQASGPMTDDSLPPFGPQILNGYDTCDDLEADIVKMLNGVANATIQYWKEIDCSSFCYDYTTTDADGNNVTLTACPYYDPYYNATSSAPQESINARRRRTTETSFTTNNKVDGVAEQDLVKSDGTHIFVGFGSDVIVTDLNGNVVTWAAVPPPSGDVNATTYLTSLLLYNSIVTAIANIYTCSASECVYATATVIYAFDPITGTLNFLNQIDNNGMPVEARNIGSNTHVFTSAPIGSWPFLEPLQRCSISAFYNVSNDYYEAAAFQIVHDTVNLFAQKTLTSLVQSDTSCKRIIKASKEAVLGKTQGSYPTFFQVTSFDTSKAALPGFKPSKYGMFSDSYDNPVVHATKDGLLIAADGNNDDTLLITFALNGATATPKAIGKVEGSLLYNGWGNSRFNIDFYNGYYRVATTFSPSVANETTAYYGLTTDSKPQVFVLQEQSTNLLVVGQISDLANGEFLQSVRFVGDKGYLETTDPFGQGSTLKLIDLSSPTNPMVGSELNVTSDSFLYMQPIQDGEFLLAFSEVYTYDKDGLKIRLFSAAGGLTPLALEGTILVTDGFSASEALYDYHAVTYLPQSSKLIIPTSLYSFHTNAYIFSGFLVYDVDLAHGVNYLGNITHGEYNYTNCWTGVSLPARSMVFNGDLVTFMGTSIKRTSDVASLKGEKWTLDLSNYC